MEISSTSPTVSQCLLHNVHHRLFDSDSTFLGFPVGFVEHHSQFKEEKQLY